MGKRSPSGVIAATFTPYYADGSINLDVIPKYVDFLVAQNVKDVFVNGTAGESMSLTVNERKQLAEKWISAGKGKITTVTVQCGANSIKDTQELAKHAESIGASCIGLLAPSYYKPKNAEMLVQYCAEVASAAPNTPLLYYHFPVMTGVAISMPDFLEAANGRVPTLDAIKFTSMDLFEGTQAHLTLNKKYNVILGGETVLLAGLAMGMKSSIGISYNIVGKPVHRLINAYEKKDIDAARKEQYKLHEFWLAVNKGGDTARLAASMKEVTSLVSGIDLGQPRLPVQPISAAEKSAIKQNLEKIGFAAWAN